MKAAFEANLSVIADLVDPTAMKSFEADRDATFAAGRALVATVPPANDRICDQFGILRQAIAVAVQRNQVAQADAAAQALSTARGRDNAASGSRYGSG